MDIQLEENSRNLIVQLTGEIDHHCAVDIRTKIDKNFERTNAKNIIFDFTNVSFMDSSGIGVLIGRYKMLEHKGLGGRIFAANVNSDVIRLFEISGLTKIIPCFGSVTEASAELLQ